MQAGVNATIRDYELQAIMTANTQPGVISRRTLIAFSGRPSGLAIFLIQPKPGWGIAYLDWVGQEFGVAAGLSSDSRLPSWSRG